MVAIVLVLLVFAQAAFAAKTCPNCGTSNRDDAKFCKNCGTAMPGPEPSKSSLPALKVETRVAPGLVQIISSPEGATVLVDGNRLGTTPITSRQLTAGKHELEITLPGYRSYHGSFFIPKPTGEILIHAAPAGVEVLLDDTPLGTVPDSGLLVGNLTLDTHALVFRLTGYREEERTVELSARRPSAQVSVELRPLTGFLSVRSEPDSATVFLNQQDVGATPYLAELTPARYQLMVSRVGFYDWYNYVEVRGRDTTTLFLALEPMRSKKAGLLVAGCVSLAFSGVSAFLGEMEYARYTEATTPGEAQRYRTSTQRWDMIRNITAGLGVLGIGTYILF
ncbi:MAG: PEGA domain-containing protein [candidate division WOR-3 bacterium]